MCSSTVVVAVLLVVDLVSTLSIYIYLCVGYVLQHPGTVSQWHKLNSTVVVTEGGRG